ncbi:MAG: hypothetical protein HYS98_03190 [Deltaproteobacteria bacterium]|nr:hypothetical protein [Deltaproteobacteria bacterium]
MKKLILLSQLVVSLSMTTLFSAGQTPESVLKPVILELFKLHCPQLCLDVFIKSSSKTTVQRSIVEPGFEESGSAAQTSTVISGIDVNILADEKLPQKTRDFLQKYIEHQAQPFQSALHLNYSFVAVPHPTIFSNLRGYFLLIFLIMSTLAAIMGIFYFMRRQRKKTVLPSVLKHESQPSPTVVPSYQEIPQGISIGDSLTIQSPAHYADLVASHLSTAKNVLKRWAASPQGLHHALQVLITLPTHLRSELKGVLNNNSAEELTSEFSKMQHLSVSDVKRIGTQFRHEIELESLLSLKENQVIESNFDFLKNLEPTKIAHLVKGEDIRCQALLLLQLDIETRSNVFKNLKDSDQKSVALELATIETLPWNELKYLSFRLAHRAAQLTSLNLYETSGFNALINLVESHDKPDELADDILKADTTLGMKLKSSIITLDLVSLLEENDLTLFLSQLSRDDIVAVLLGKLSAYKNLIISKLPPQIAEYVALHIEEDFKRKVTPSKIVAAEKAVLTSLKALFHNGQLNLEEIQRDQLWVQPGVFRDHPTLR